jgi:cytochrome c peroxidase
MPWAMTALLLMIKRHCQSSEFLIYFVSRDKQEPAVYDKVIAFYFRITVKVLLVKRSYLLFAFLLIAVLALQNCKPEPKITKGNNDPDSLYVGTKYVWPTTLFQFPVLTNSYADSMTNEGVALGRRLFYDKHLSSTGLISCASCHQLSHAFTDSGKAFSTTVNGPTFRNTMALINLAWSPYFDFDGRQPTLAAQAQEAFHDNMGFSAPTAITYLQTDTVDVKLFKKAFGRPGTITETGIYKALQQFLMTAISSNSKFDQYRQQKVSFTSSELNGLTIFASETGDCFHCHMSEGGQSLLMTDNLFRNNGLDSVLEIHAFKDAGRGAITLNANDYGKFKDPTLRNIALTGPYMHDGRYTTLMQVINFYSDSTHDSPTEDPIMLLYNHNYGRGLQLAPSQKTDLLNFLYTLTDTSFLDNPALSNPF